MRPGITIQHTREVARDSGLVRSDVTGILGVIPKARWPRGATLGDYVELPLHAYAELLQSPARGMFDPVSRRAVQSFFENGGATCRLLGVCLSAVGDLLVSNPGETVLAPVLERLRGHEDLGLVTMPLLAYLPVDGVGRDLDVRCQPVLESLVHHCREMNNRFLIVDTPKDLHERDLRRWVRRFRGAIEGAASYCAVYYPWLMSGEEMFPPGGSVAGVFARSERDHAPFGVRWPPANQLVQGITHPAVDLFWRETGALTDAGINPILTQPGRGVVIWGARTLSRDPKWVHINSRRIVSYVSEQLRRDAEWAVFEQQRPELWKILERTVRNRLDQLWEGGLLTGDRAGVEYLVQCDEELNPPAVRDAGEVNVRVRIRPISTTEYIVVDLRLTSDAVTTGGV